MNKGSGSHSRWIPVWGTFFFSVSFLSLKLCDMKNSVVTAPQSLSILCMLAVCNIPHCPAWEVAKTWNKIKCALVTSLYCSCRNTVSSFYWLWMLIKNADVSKVLRQAQSAAAFGSWLCHHLLFKDCPDLCFGMQTSSENPALLFQSKINSHLSWGRFWLSPLSCSDQILLSAFLPPIFILKLTIPQTVRKQPRNASPVWLPL